MDAAVVAPVPVWSSPCGAAAAAAGAAGVAAGATAAPTPTAAPNTASRPTPNPASRRAVFIADSSWVALAPEGGAVSYRDSGAPERRGADGAGARPAADGCAAATDRGDGTVQERTSRAMASEASRIFSSASGPPAAAACTTQ